jgi:hypothetical protein
MCLENLLCTIELLTWSTWLQNTIGRNGVSGWFLIFFSLSLSSCFFSFRFFECYSGTPRTKFSFTIFGRVSHVSVDILFFFPMLDKSHEDWCLVIVFCQFDLLCSGAHIRSLWVLLIWRRQVPRSGAQFHLSMMHTHHPDIFPFWVILPIFSWRR